jgi:hypothetical protein
VRYETGEEGEMGVGGERVCLMNARTCRLLLTEIIQLVGDIIHARLGQLPTPPHTYRDTNKIARKDNRKKNIVFYGFSGVFFSNVESEKNYK